MSANLNTPLESRHNCSTASSASDDEAGGLASVLNLKIGSLVMLRPHLWVEKGLATGCKGSSILSLVKFT